MIALNPIAAWNPRGAATTDAASFYLNLRKTLDSTES